MCGVFLFFSSVKFYVYRCISDARWLRDMNEMIP